MLLALALSACGGSTMSAPIKVGSKDFSISQRTVFALPLLTVSLAKLATLQ